MPKESKFFNYAFYILCNNVFYVNVGPYPADAGLRPQDQDHALLRPPAQLLQAAGRGVAGRWRRHLGQRRPVTAASAGASLGGGSGGRRSATAAAAVGAGRCAAGRNWFYAGAVCAVLTTAAAAGAAAAFTAPVFLSATCSS